MVSKLAKAKQQPGPQMGDILDQTAFWALSMLLFLPSFFRGLFFAPDQIKALIFATLLFGLVSIIEYKRRRLIFFASPLEWLILGLPVVYLLSTVTAANYTLAINEIIKNSLYFFAFWSALRLIHNKGNVEKLTFIIYLSAIGVSLAGLFTATGLIEIKDGFLTSDGGTIASTFQYKNSLASFLIVAIFIGHYLWGKLDKKPLNIAITVGNLLLLTVLFSTQSHGGYIVFGVFTILYWFLNPASKRFSLILGFLILSALGITTSHLFLKNIAANRTGMAWLIVIAVLLIVALLRWLTSQANELNKPRPVFLKHLLIITGLIALFSILGLSLLGGFQIILEKIHILGAMERITMYQDGLKMLGAKPLLGWGGGGWSEAYSQFQGYAYNVRQTHSYFLQTAIETGLVGLLLVISIWVMFVVKAYKIYKKSLPDSSQTALVATLLCSVFAIISHAAFDFDLSLSALTIVMFTLMACLLAIGEVELPISNLKEKGNIEKTSWHKLGIAIVMVFLIITISLTIMSSGNLATAAVTAVRSGDGVTALPLIEKAISMNPLASENYGVAAQLYSAYGKTTEAVENGEKAVQTARYNPNRYEELAQVYLKVGKSKEAVAAAHKAVELAPLKVEYYETYAGILNSAAINDLMAGHTQTAKSYLQQALAIPKQIDSVFKSVDPDKKKLWLGMHDPPLVVTDKIKLSLGVAQMWLGHLDQAANYIGQVAQNQQLQKESAVWQALLAERQGDSQKAQEILKKAQKDNPNINEQFKQLVSIKPLS